MEDAQRQLGAVAAELERFQGEAMEKTLAWAESELEGFMRS